ncbi:aminodeoxychorismate lyase [Marinomonas fungiae]|uniref:Aminodeoxychorismate lyase n=1 Tax=Marinomonas fungiae TaxID=1137284 RepID=A0A0K6IKD6_9GAMM|nr:aminodeoxychorismate lyase [Marinomonas fungiae]CUB03569.1 aminodeoxychorismate lyase [Marinomonas fungiae]
MQWFRNFKPNTSLAISDRGLAYGDGLFETIATVSGTIPSLLFHQARLARGCKRLGFDVSKELWQQWWGFVQSLAEQMPNCGIKVMVTRGSGGRGYLPPLQPDFEFLVGVFEMPNYQAQQKEGVSLLLSPIQASINRSLSGLKHLGRLENVLAKQALSNQAFEAVLLDANKHLVECVQSNLFWLKNNQLFTPALHQSGVQGSFRAKVLLSFEGVVNIGSYGVEALYQADEIFITNGLSGILPVTQFEDKSLPIGRLTQKLMDQV